MRWFMPFLFFNKISNQILLNLCKIIPNQEKDDQNPIINSLLLALMAKHYITMAILSAYLHFALFVFLVQFIDFAIIYCDI